MKTLSTVSAATITGCIKMHVILMEPISIWPKRSSKSTAGCGIHFAQHRPVFGRPPMLQNRNECAIVQSKPGNIDSVAFGVFRHLCPALAVSCSTGIV